MQGKLFKFTYILIMQGALSIMKYLGARAARLHNLCSMCNEQLKPKTKTFHQKEDEIHEAKDQKRLSTDSTDSADLR